MDLAFWSAPHRWPPDLAKHVFLARAYDQIGRARFPDVWTGEEAVTPPPRRERKVPVWSPAPAINNALTVIVGKPSTWDIGPSEVPEATVAAAEELLETERADRTNAIVRSGTIIKLMLEKAAAGILKLAYLPADNSTPLRPCPEAWWQTTFPVVLRRLWTCRIDPSNPLSLGGPCAEGGAWLFVSRESLQATLEQLGPAPEEGNPKSRAGRKKGSTFVALDTPLLENMRQRIEGEGVSIHAASLAVAKEAFAAAEEAKAATGQPLPLNLRSSVASSARRLARAYPGWRKTLIDRSF